MKDYTSLEQSKTLAEILPLGSEDMEYMFLKRDGSKVSNVPFVKDGFEEPECCYIFIPCWSLASLLNVLDFPSLSKDKLGSGETGWMVSVYQDNYRYDSCWHNNPIDACVEMIIRLHKEKLL